MVNKLEHCTFEYVVSPPTRLNARTTNIVMNIPYNLRNCCSIFLEDRAAEHFLFF